jgi:hypothetical protein
VRVDDGLGELWLTFSVTNNMLNRCVLPDRHQLSDRCDRPDRCAFIADRRSLNRVLDSEISEIVNMDFSSC